MQVALKNIYTTNPKHSLRYWHDYQAYLVDNLISVALFVLCVFLTLISVTRALKRCFDF